MDNNLITYLACICFIFLFGKLFIVPLKKILKLILNSILGGISIYIINLVGANFGFHIGLNFFTRRNSQGEGTIVITSTRPMTEAELNIILKIQEGSASHLKHIRQPIRRSVDPVLAKSIAEKPLTPKFIVSEKDIALNLPVSTRFNANTSESKEQSLKQEILLNAPYKLPPVLNNDDSYNPCSPY